MTPEGFLEEAAALGTTPDDWSAGRCGAGGTWRALGVPVAPAPSPNPGSAPPPRFRAEHSLQSQRRDMQLLSAGLHAEARAVAAP